MKDLLGYDKGFERIGCIGCPRSYSRRFELNYFPKFYNAYMKAIEKMLKNPKKKDKSRTAQEIMDWWLSDKGKPDPSQRDLFI
jgi:phosphoadenosine phosphosulfate reductase